jgi:hypothetical protein
VSFGAEREQPAVARGHEERGAGQHRCTQDG